MDWLWAILKPILAALFAAVTPMLKEEMGKGIRALYQLALNTSNPIDDGAVKLLADITGVDVSGMKATAAGAVTAASTVKAIESVVKLDA